MKDPSIRSRLEMTPDLEERLSAFEQSWQSGQPRLEDFLPPVADHSDETQVRRRRSGLIELIKIDLEYRWRSVQDGAPRYLLHDYLGRHAELDGGVPLGLIEEEYRVRHRWGDRPRHEEFVQRFSEHGDALVAALRRIDAELIVEFAAEPAFAVVNPHDASTIIGRGSLTDGKQTDEHEPALPRVAGYEILEVLGRGGMGVVYKARHLALNRVVAFKMILAGGHASPDQVARFRAEAEAVARLQHPNIVQIHEIGERNGLPYFSLEFCEGGSLAMKLNGTPLTAKEAARLVEILARAMHEAHKKNIIHRDLKPHNILLTADGTPKITDFGLAKKLDDAAHTATGAVMGTPSYMAPEQAAGRVKDIGPATDVYALGAILYELLTGRPPFKAATAMDTVIQVVSDEPVPPRRLQPKVSKDLETVCLKCLEKEPTRRYENAENLAEDLRRYLHHEPIRSRPVTPTERLIRWCYRKPLDAALLGTVVVLLVCLAVGGILAAVRFGAMFAESEKSREQAWLKNEEAQKERAYAEKAKRASEAALTDMYISHGLIADERGDPALAALWFANALALDQKDPASVENDTLPSVGDPDREFVNRVRARAWLRQTSSPVSAIHFPQKHIVDLAFHPIGNYLLVGMLGNRNLKRYVIWDVLEDKVVTWATESASFTGAVWSPDGQSVALLSESGELEIRAFPNGEVRERISSAPKWARVLTFCPTGKHLAVGGSQLKLWDVEKKTWSPLSFDQPVPVMALRFNKSGDCLATAGLDSTARVFRVRGDPASGNALFPPVPHKIAFRPFSVSLAPLFLDNDHDLITVTSAQQLARRNALTGKIVELLPFYEPTAKDPQIACLVVSPDTRSFLAGAFMGAKLWSYYGKNVYGHFLPHPHNAASAAFHPTSYKVLTACGDNLARLWQPQKGKLEPVTMPHATSVSATAFSASGQFFATGQENGLIRLWAMARGNSLNKVMPIEGPSGRVALTLDGKFLLPRSTSHWNNELRNTRLWELASSRPASPAFVPQGIIIDAVLSPDGKEVAISSSPGLDAKSRRTAIRPPSERSGNLHLFDVQTGSTLFGPLRMPSEPRSLAYSPDGKLLAVHCAASQMILFDVSERKVIRQWKYGAAYTEANHFIDNGGTRFSLDGKFLIAWGIDSRLHVWDCATGAPPYPALQHEERCHDAQFSSDGRLLVTAAYDNKVRVFDFATGRRLGAILDHPDWVFTAKFSADGRHLVTAGRDWMARVWDWQSGGLACAPFSHQSEVFDSVFSSNGRFVLTTGRDNSFRVWDPRTGKQVTPAFPLKSDGLSICLTPDSEYAVVAGFMSEICVFHLGDLADPGFMDSKDLCLVGEVLSGQRVYEGGLVKLTTEEWLERWHIYRQKDLPSTLFTDDPLTFTWGSEEGGPLKRAPRADIGSTNLLRDQTGLTDAVHAHQKAIEHDHTNPRLHYQLGEALRKAKRFAEAIAAYQKTVQIDPTFASAYNGMGLVFGQQKMNKDAIAAYQKAIDVKPTVATYHNNLGFRLREEKRLTEAVAALQKAIELNASYAMAYSNLGDALHDQNKLAEASAAYRKAIEVDPKFPNAHAGLAVTLHQQGSFAAAAKAGEMALQLLPAGHPLRGRIQRELRQSQSMAGLEKRLEAVLNSREAATPLELLAIAHLCRQDKKKYLTAVRLYQEAFKAQTTLSEDLSKQHRYAAACAAALSGIGQGEEASKLSIEDKNKLLQTALGWLEDDLNQYHRLLKGAEAYGVMLTAQHLSHWQTDPALAGVREPVQLARLAAEERPNWQTLWVRVGTLLKDARSRFTESHLQGALSYGKREQMHELKMTIGNSYTIDMTSSQFDTYLRLEDSKGNILAQNDDISKDNLNSRIVFTPSINSAYRIAATSYQQRGAGPYTITIHEFALTSK